MLAATRGVATAPTRRATRGRGERTRGARVQRAARAEARREDDEDATVGKRCAAVVAGCALALAMASARVAVADSLPDEVDVKVLCDAACEARLEGQDFKTTKSGLRYKEIKEGDGMEPPVGFQVVVDYIAMDEKGRIFDNSLAKGKPNDIRVVDCVGSGDFDSCTVIPGMDEGLLTMKSGGVRRLYIPGELSFPKGLASAPGRPKVPPFSPVVFDVNLLYIPGFD